MRVPAVVTWMIPTGRPIQTQKNAWMNGDIERSRCAVTVLPVWKQQMQQISAVAERAAG